MSNFMSVEFPMSPQQPTRIHSAVYRQQNYEHDYARISFRDWGLSPTQIKTGALMRIKLQDKELVGYVHEIRNKQTPKENFTEVVFIGASYVMRQASQEIYTDVTADQIVKRIAIKYGFSYKVVPHPRVFPQVAQAGMTDWELMVRLAKQCGYFLRAENTSIYFQPLMQDFNDLILESLSFKKNDAGAKSPMSLYSFAPIVGETLSHFGADKSATSVAGIDPRTGMEFKYTKQVRTTPTRAYSQPEFFDKQATTVVANSYDTAKYESYSADDKSQFPYIADATVIGFSQLRPGLPVHFDGVGTEYSGYWTVLSVEHEITEPSLNQFMYVSRVSVGSDSLGPIANSNIPMVPPSNQTRYIHPNIRNTIKKPRNVINSPIVNVKPIGTTTLVARVNRANVSGQTVARATWVSDSGDLGAPAPVTSRSDLALRKAHNYYATH